MLTGQQYKCIEYLILGTLTQIKIAEILQISDQTISNWKKDLEFTSEHDRLLRESFKNYVPEARDTLIDLMRHSESDMVKLNATKDLLDRAGYKPTEKTENKNVNDNTNRIVLVGEVEEWAK